MHIGKWISVLACLALAACAAVSQDGDTKPVVAMADDAWQLDIRRRDNSVVYRLDLPPDGQWCMGWNHSVAGFPVTDCYGVHEGQLRLENSHQPDFAAGLGHIEGRGRMESDGAGGYNIVDINEPVPGNAYFLRVGAMAVNHRILLEDQVYSLSDLAAGERVLIRLVRP